MRTLRAHLVLVLALSAPLAGCAGDGSGMDDPGMDDDWSWDAGPPGDDDWGSPDGGTSDPPPATGGAFCDQLGSYAERCTMDECSQAMLADCGALTGIVNESFLDSAGVCLEGSAGLGSCMAGALAGMAPTAAHREFATAFCSECVAIGAETCEASFFDGESGEAGAAGKLILPLGESVVARMTDECTSGLTCAAQIQSCTQRILVEEGLPDEVARCLVTSLVDGGGSAPSCDGTTDPDLPTDPTDPPPATCDATYEPNDLTVTAEEVGSINDRASYPAGTVATAVSPGDVDWYRYDVDDAIGGAVAPRVQLTTTVGSVRLCAFWSCSDERDGEASCPATGSTPETLALGSREIDGCCAGAGGRVDLGVNCPGLDDSGTVYVRVDEGADAAECNTYELEWGDD